MKDGEQLAFKGFFIAVSPPVRAAFIEQTRILLRTHQDWPAIANLRSHHRHDPEATAIINDLVALTDDDREEYA